jgi:hypothetical protein
MPMVRAMRLLNSIEAGTTSGPQLQAQLVNGGVQSDFNSIMQLPGQCTVLAASITALTAINLSPIATNLTAVGIPSNFALSRNSLARAFLFSTGTNLLTACVTAAPQNWYPYATWTRAFGAGLNNVRLGPTGSIGNYIAFGNGVYVATSGTTSRNVWTSTDGLNWTVRTNALPVQADGRWMGVRFGNGVFIAVSGGSATSNTAATSTDGITWTAQTLPTLAQWMNLDCGLVGGTFTWVATSGGTANSTATARSTNNGATWVSGGTVSSSCWSSITYIGGVFVTVPGSVPFLSSIANSTGWRSTDGGVSWSSFGLPTSVNWLGVAAVPSTPTRWIAVNNSGNNFAISSDSGATWSDLSGTADGGTGWILPTGTGLITYNKYSDNGVSWFSMPAASNQDNGGSVSAIFANGFVRNIYTSAPFFYTYSQLNPSSTGFFYGFSNSFKPTCALTIGTTYYQFGYGGYYVSTDQITWTFTPVSAFTLLGGPVSVAHNGTNTFVAVFGGANGAQQTNNQFARSTDNGVTWSFVGGVSTTQWTSIAYGGGRFVAVAGQPNPSINGGTHSSGNQGVWSADNGATWNSSNLNSNSQWSHVAYLNGSFVVVGNGGQVFYSTDNGSSFSGGASTTTSPGRQIAFGVVGGVNTWCVIGSNNSTVTIDTITGTTYPVTTSATTNLTSETQMSAITFNNGFFFASTNYATGNAIYSSVNGRTWTRIALPAEAVRPSNFLNTPGPTGVLYYNTSVASSILGTYNI